MDHDNQEWLKLWRGLLARRKTEESAFARAVTRRLIQTFRSRGCSENEIEDLCQSCLEKLFRNNRKLLRQYDPDRAPFPVYLTVIAISHLRSQHRNLSAQVKEKETDIAAEVDIAHDNQADTLLLVNKLKDRIQLLEPPDDRLTILLHIDGLKDREIAELLGVPMGTVATRIRRARSNLREPD